MTCNGHLLYLFCYPAGKLRVVAGEQCRVIKEVRCDALGRILDDSNPAMMIPRGFAGGLHGRDVGRARFGCRCLWDRADN